VEGEGDMHYPSTGQKFKSTFQNTKKVSDISEAKLGTAEPEEVFQFDESEGEEAVPVQKGRWEPIQVDHYGYTLKHDAHNNLVRYDEHGYQVDIDEDGRHTKYNA
jgi:hypothetical protein